MHIFKDYEFKFNLMNTNYKLVTNTSIQLTLNVCDIPTFYYTLIVKYNEVTLKRIKIN